MDQAAPASGDIAASSSGSSTASPAVSTDSTQTAAPATQATPNPITDSTSQGEPPQERWPDILKNQREAAKAEALKEWREKYGWAESVQRDQLEEMSNWYGRYKGDPGDFLEHAYQEALNHPVHGATVKSRIGRMLASMKAQQQQADVPQPEIEPDIPVLDQSGNVVNQAYSAKAMKEIVKREIAAALGKEVGPLKEDFETRKSQAQKAQEKAQQEARADQDIGYVTKMPGFEDHKPDILAVFNANPKFSLRQAYDEVLRTKIFPSYGQKAEAKVLSDLQQKANAQTPGTGTPSGSAPPKFKNFADAHAYYEKHPEEAERMAQR